MFGSRVNGMCYMQSLAIAFMVLFLFFRLNVERLAGGGGALRRDYFNLPQCVLYFEERSMENRREGRGMT